MRTVSLMLMLACAAVAGACKESKSAPPATGASVTGSGGPGGGATAAGGAAPDAGAVTPAPREPDLREREGGPTRAVCEQVADQLAKFVVDGMVASTATAEQRAYVEANVKKDRARVLEFCLQSATPEEAACIVKAADFPALAACERFRRQVPKDLASRTEVTLEDCQKVFERLRQFKIDEGVAPSEIDKDKDQIIRACQEKAKPGTVACFITARTYEEARRCP